MAYYVLTLSFSIPSKISQKHDRKKGPQSQDCGSSLFPLGGGPFLQHHLPRQMVSIGR